MNFLIISTVVVSFKMTMMVLLAGTLITAKNSPTFKTHPNSTEVEEGGRLKLICLIDNHTRCGWEHNGALFATRTMYSPATYNEFSSDCTLTFRSVLNVDYGIWRCLSYGEANFMAIFSRPAVVTIKESLRWNIDATDKGTNVSVSCIFSGQSNCSWLSSGPEFQTANFYSIRNNLYNETLNFTNCTLSMRSAKKNDRVTWECFNRQQKIERRTTPDLFTTVPTQDTSLHSDSNETSNNSVLLILVAVGVIFSAIAVCSIIAYIVKRDNRIAKELNELRAASSAANSQTCQQMAPRLGTMEHAYTELTEDDEAEDFSITVSGYLVPLQFGSSRNRRDMPLPLVPISEMEVDKDQIEVKQKHVYDEINHSCEN